MIMRYGIYNIRAKKFQFGINEPSKRKARNKLFAKIGKDAYKWRFQVKRINDNIMQKGRRKYER